MSEELEVIFKKFIRPVDCLYFFDTNSYYYERNEQGHVGVRKVTWRAWYRRELTRIISTVDMPKIIDNMEKVKNGDTDSIHALFDWSYSPQGSNFWAEYHNKIKEPDQILQDELDMMIDILKQQSASNV